MGTLTAGSKTINIVNITEDEAMSANVTQYPVEEGSPVSDHIQFSSKSLQISGYLLGDSAENDYLTILDWQNTGATLSYKGRVYFHGVYLSNVSKSLGRISNGFGFTCTLTVIRKAKTSWVKLPTKGKQQVTPPASKEVYVTVKAGNTYWGWWRQYGTPIQTLRNWNKWPDRFIPIGKRARVK